MTDEREQNCSLQCSHLHLRLSNIQSRVVQEKLIEDLESLLQAHQGSLDFVILEGNMSQVESTTVAKALMRIFDILGCVDTLKYLWMEFEESIIPAEVLARCLMRANALSSLHLVGVRISGSKDDVSVLTASIKALSYLKRVDLIDCKALNPNVSLEPMIKALSTATTLEKVTLLTVCPPSLSSSDELLAEFCRSTSLKTLFWIQLMRTKDDDIVQMAKSLHGNNTLRELVIFSDVAGAKAGKAIGQMLTTNKSLKRLTFFLNNFHHALPIAEALETNASLKNLRIKSVGSAVPQHVVKRFCKMLESNYTVTSLDLCHFVPEIDLYLRLNKAGRRNLLMRDNLYRWEEWAKCVVSNTGDLDILFYLLKQNPVFVGTLSASSGS